MLNGIKRNTFSRIQKVTKLASDISEALFSHVKKIFEITGLYKQKIWCLVNNPSLDKGDAE